MFSSCFYGGVFTEDGYRAAISGNEFGDVPKIFVSGSSPAIKQKIFDMTEAELCEKNIDYSELCAGEKICGIFCKNFLIFDSDFYEKNIEKSVEFLSEKFLKTDSVSEEKNKRLCMKKEKEILRARRFLSACKTVSDDMMRLEGAYLNHKKINAFTSELWQRITLGMNGHIGRETRRFVTCLTADGNELNMEAFDTYCEKMFVIADRTGTCAREIVDSLRGYALGSGYDVISCPCAVNGELIEHLIIPELGFGVFTSKYYHRDDFENARKIYAKRFLYPSVESIKNRIDFSVKTYRNLMDEVFASLEKIKKIEAELDEIICKKTDMTKLKNELFSVLF